MPGGSRSVLLREVAAKARASLGRERPDVVLRRALFEAAFFEISLRTLGPAGWVETGGRFHPLFALPDYRGPHFDEALRRLVLPGRGPWVAHLSVTGACACRCDYCYASAGGPDAPDAGDETVLSAARAIARHGVPLVILTGGEPLARYGRVERLVEILAPSCEVRLATSGVGLTPGRAKALHERGLAAVAVGLDSADAESVNRTRGYRRAFEAATQALRICAAEGLATFATSVVGADTFATPDDAVRLLRLVRSIDPRVGTVFVPRFAAGRARAQGIASPEKWAPLARRVADAVRREGLRAAVLSNPLEALMGCTGGAGKQLHVDIRGRVTPCIAGAGVGSLQDEPFDVLHDRLVASATRLKRGFLCSVHGADGDWAPDAAVALLRRFARNEPDAGWQRMLAVAGPAAAWMLGTSLPQAPRRLRRSIPQGAVSQTGSCESTPSECGRAAATADWRETSGPFSESAPAFAGRVAGSVRTR